MRYARISMLTMSACVMGWTVPSYAQGASPDGAAPNSSEASGLGEIVVTAQKRAESLQDTPISIAAFDGGTLEAKRIVSVADLSSAVPNMQVAPHPNSGTTLRVTIRGIGEPSATQTRDAPVAVYVDGVYVAKGQGLANELAELERVEVLRGPQGTLYGRNATAGAINFITRPPELGEWKAKQSFTFGSRDEFRSRTSVNIPIGETLATELTYVRVKKDGFVKNLGAGSGHYGDTDRQAIRAALLWKPSDNVEGRYTYDSSWIEDTSPYNQAVPFSGKEVRERTGSTGNVPLRPGNSRVQGHNLTLAYELGDNLTIKSITGYRKLRDETNQVYDPGVTRLYLPFSSKNNTHQKQFSQELQMIGDAFEGALKYIGGLYYFSESGNVYDVTDAPSGLSPRKAHWNNKAYAVFGQATWTPQIMDERLHITVGARWSKDSRKANVFSTRTPPIGNTQVLLDASGSKSFTNFSPTATVQFDINRDVNVYAKVSRGYKTGGFNPTASSASRFAAGFGPETLTSYEAGLKSELLDRRVRFNIAAYYSKYKDIQTNVFDPYNPQQYDVINAGKAITKGIEADLTVLAFDGMTLTGSYGYTAPKFKQVKDLGGNDVTDLYRFIFAPKHSFTLSADYKSDETPIGIVEANLNFSWQDKYFTQAMGPLITVRQHGLLGGRIGLSNVAGVHGLRVAVWARNLTDKKYYANNFIVGDVPLAQLGEPRSIGIDASIEF